MTPGYLKHSFSVPLTRRAAWYQNTFLTYMGIFLWVGFYLKLAEPNIGQASLCMCFWGLLAAGLLCFYLYYYVSAMLGMKTGRPVYVVGSSTFGVTGGYLIPGLLMGILQLGWVAVQASVRGGFILKGLHQRSKGLFAVIVAVWIYGLAWSAIKGIRYVANFAKILNWMPLVMILIVFWANGGGIAHYVVPHPNSSSGFADVLAIVIGYFATAGAAGADLGMNNRSRKDIVLGGLFGVVLGVLLAGGLPILSVAGYIGKGAGPSSYEYTAAIAIVGTLAPVMFFLFSGASVVPTCFSSFIALNSFQTMLPRVPRSLSTLAGVTISALLAITGVANHLLGFFVVVGVSFGTICGAMAADYLLAGRPWSGPRRGINWAG